jgi:hypothetical protein
VIRIELGSKGVGEHTRIHSTLCSQCPHGPTGCCASPPGVDWSDIGRILTLGGMDWLLREIEAGNLRGSARGLMLRRVANQEANAGVWPTKCVYHGAQGCTIDPERRAATCNYYICDDAFAFGGEHQRESTAVQARAVHAQLMALYGRWDLALLAQIETVYPRGPRWDRPFLQWLQAAYQKQVQSSRRELKKLGQS